MSREARAVGDWYWHDSHCMVCKDLEPDLLYQRVFNKDQFIGKEVWIEDALHYWDRVTPFLQIFEEDYWLVRSDMCVRAYEVGCDKEFLERMVKHNLSMGDRADYCIYEVSDGVYSAEAVKAGELAAEDLTELEDDDEATEELTDDDVTKSFDFLNE